MLPKINNLVIKVAISVAEWWSKWYNTGIVKSCIRAVGGQRRGNLGRVRLQKAERRLRVLISSFEHSVDAKGRVFIPAKWRDDLGDTIVITRDLPGEGDTRCLFGMSLQVWNEMLERFKRIAISDAPAQNAMRMLFAGATDCELDKQGRALLSANLRQYAGIDKDAVLIGMGNRIEIWSAQRWNKHCEENDKVSAETLRYLTELGI